MMSFQVEFFPSVDIFKLNLCALFQSTAVADMSEECPIKSKIEKACHPSCTVPWKEYEECTHRVKSYNEWSQAKLLADCKRREFKCYDSNNKPLPKEALVKLLEEGANCSGYYMEYWHCVDKCVSLLLLAAPLTRISAGCTQDFCPIEVSSTVGGIPYVNNKYKNIKKNPSPSCIICCTWKTGEALPSKFLNKSLITISTILPLTPSVQHPLVKEGAV